MRGDPLQAVLAYSLSSASIATILTFGSLTLRVKEEPGGMLGDSVLGRVAEARATGPTCGMFPSGTLDLGSTTSLGTGYTKVYFSN